MKPQVIVVEGKNDAAKIRSIFEQAIVITTNGSAIDNKSLEILKKMDETHDIVLFLDPDHAGERIRRILSKSLKNVYHAFIQSDIAYSKNHTKIGVEHAKSADIIQSLKCIRPNRVESKSDVTYPFLFEIGLLGKQQSKILRNQISEYFNLGSPNGKTFYQRIKMFNIMKSEILEVLR